MNSLPWIGKILGCFGSEAFIDRSGYKRTMYAAAGIQIVALISKNIASSWCHGAILIWSLVEMTAHNWVQFTVGRIVAYFAVGMVENAVPSYNAETSPAATRGLLSGSIMVVTSLGNLWGAGMSRAFSTTVTDKGWMVPTAMQFIPALGLLLLVPLTPESPRWLILRGQKQQAKHALDTIRPKQDVLSGATAAEVDAIEQMIEESLANEKGSWLELFHGTYLVRTWVRRKMA